LNHIGGVMVVVGSSNGRVKLKTIKLVFVASPLTCTRHDIHVCDFFHSALGSTHSLTHSLTHPP